MNNIAKTIGLIFIVTLVTACQPQVPTVKTECIGWKAELALKTDSKEVMMEKLERNTAMQRICQ